MDLTSLYTTERSTSLASPKDADDRKASVTGELSADSAFMTAYFVGYVCITTQFLLQGEYLFSLFCDKMMVAHGRGSFVNRFCPETILTKASCCGLSFYH